MVQAARSGCQNIAEGSQTSSTSKQSELRLVTVARASLEELLLDYQDFLRQHHLTQWSRDDSHAQAIRQLAYVSNRSYSTYESYISEPESAANCAISLMKQATYLLDKQMQALEQELLKNGDMPERVRTARNDEKKKEMFLGDDMDEFLAEHGMKRLENGQVVEK